MNYIIGNNQCQINENEYPTLRIKWRMLMTLKVDSTLKEIKADVKGKEILEKFMPGIWEAPQTKLAMRMTLKQIASFPQAGIDEEKLQAIVDEFSQI